MTRRREGVEWSCLLLVPDSSVLSEQKLLIGHLLFHLLVLSGIVDMETARGLSVLYPFLVDPGNFELINYQAAEMGRNKFLEPSHLSPPIRCWLLNIFATLWEIFLCTIHTTTINELEMRNNAYIDGFVLLVCCYGPWSVNMIDIGWNISQLTVVHNVGCGMGWCVTRCLPGAGATEPCLSVPIFLNIIPRRMRDGTQFSMTYNPQPSLHIRVYATYVWVKTRQHFFIS